MAAISKNMKLGLKKYTFQRVPISQVDLTQKHRHTHTHTHIHTHTLSGTIKAQTNKLRIIFISTPFLILLFAVRLSSENGPSSAEHSRALPKWPNQPVQLFRYLSNGPSMVVKKQKNLLIFFTQRISEFLKGWLFRLFFVEAVAVFGQIVSKGPNS